MSAYLRVEDWVVKTHGISSKKHWLDWSSNTQPFCTDEAIAVNFVPKSILRRASQQTTLALDAALELTLGLTPDYLIFASQHGEITRSRELLDAIERRTDLSPTAFSQSVHNTAVGQYTIIKKSNTKATSIAAGQKTICMALIEALAF